VKKTGVYILKIKLDHPTTLTYGKKHTSHFPKGYYYYVGSALNNLEARINRHLSQEKKIHWHIDYLLKVATIEHIYYKITTEKEECPLAQTLAIKLDNIPNFGSSDCTCKSHLYYTSNPQSLDILNNLILENYPILTKN
jgi:endonuclease-3